jgi:hypothetical protein
MMILRIYEDDDGDPVYIFTSDTPVSKFVLDVDGLEEIVLTELWVWGTDPNTKPHVRDAIRTVVTEIYHDGLDPTTYLKAFDTALAEKKTD